ncbi:hypothetical protein GCM10022420_064200 [Streptomyces iranensis]
MDGAAPAGVSPSVMVAATVASVGPYALTMWRPGAQSETSSAEHASPPTISPRTVPRLPAGIIDSGDGGIIRWVIRRSSSSVARSGPGVRRSSGAHTRVAPVKRALDSSQNEASKLGETNCSTRSPGPTRCLRRCTATALARPRWLTTTPLGRPVEPEV